MRAIGIAALCACGAPAAPPSAPVANHAATSHSLDRETDLTFAGDCNTDSAGGDYIDETELAWIVTCKESASKMAAYLVRGPSTTHGTSRLLGRWDTEENIVESYDIAAPVYDTARHARHVLIIHERIGVGADQRTELLDYLPDRDTFGPETFRGLEIYIRTVGSGTTPTRIETCRVKPASTWDPTHDCQGQPGALLEAYELPP